MDSVEGPGKSPSLKTGNPSEYGYIYSAERPKPPPEVGWKEKQGEDQRINLYSENVLKEGDTTEAVDRESIANLSTTKRQWETIFTSNSPSSGEDTLKRKGTPKWEVRLPYTEKRSAPPAQSTNHEDSEEPSGTTSDNSEEQPAMFKKPVDTESAIEREIRLAHERDEMLKREFEERKKLVEKQQQSKSQGQNIIAKYEAVSSESESCQPAYNELTEADRGPELWGVQAGTRKEDDEDENDSGAEEVNPNESIIEREIRLQREKEEEIARMRKQSSSAVPQQQQIQPQHQQQVSSPPEPAHIQPEEDEDVNHNQTKAVTYEAAISKTSHEGESLIARELREQKEREEEMRRIHSSLKGTHISDEVDGPAEADTSTQKPSTLNVSSHSQKQQQSSPSPAQGTWQRDVSPFVSQNRKGSVDSTSSHSTGRAPSDTIPSRRDVRVQPLSDGLDDDADSKPNYFQKQETPIEREMRIARERENELRRLKGLPEIVQKDEDPYTSYGASHESNVSGSLSRPRSVGQPTDSMKKFASSRLQQELQQQKERELALRSEGKIISTSEEHIEPLKYMEVAGVDKVDGREKRNFVTKKSSVSYAEAEAPHAQQDGTSSPSAQSTTARKTSAAAGGQLFSYKEFKQTAESKIERELREMREREEELRMQRTGGQAETTQ